MAGTERACTATGTSTGDAGAGGAATSMGSGGAATSSSSATSTGSGGAATSSSSATSTGSGGAATSSSTATSTGSGGAGPVPSPLIDGLVAHYTFDDGAGLVAHESTGLGTDGVLYNFPTDDSQWVPGVIGGALQLRGVAFGDAVIAPNYVKPTASMAASAWVWAKSAPPWAMVVANWGDAALGQFHFGLESTTGKLSVHFDAAFTATAADTAPLSLGSWRHVAFVADAVAKTVTLYQDGQPVGAPGAYDGALVSPPMSALGIGVKTNDSGTQPDTANPGYWDGKLDDVGVWTRALSPTEVALIHQAGLVGVAIHHIETLPSGHPCSTNVTCASGSCLAGTCS